MAITLKEMVGKLEEIGYRVMVPENQSVECGLRFGTESYVNPEGDQSLLLICRISEDGGYLEIFAPQVYIASSCKYKTALFATMLHVAYMTKHLQLEYDPSDGEVRFAVDIPVCDGTVTTQQFYSMIRCITAVMEEYHPVFARAMETGKIDMSLAWRPKEAEPETPAQPKTPMPAELATLLEKLGGFEAVERLIAEQKAAEGGGR